MTVDALAADSVATNSQTGEPSLDERREALRNRLLRDQVPTVLGTSIEAVGRAVQRLSGRPEPFSYRSSAAIATGIVGSTFAVEILTLGGGWTGQRGAISLRLMFLGMFAMTLWAQRMGVLRFSSVVGRYLVDHTERPEDLTDLERLRSLIGGYRVVLAVAFSVVVGVIWEALNVRLVYSRLYDSATPSVGGVFVHTVFMMATLDVLGSWIFLIRLGRFRVRLYAPDPSRSELIIRLSAMLRMVSLLMAVFAVCLTLALTLLGLTHWFVLAKLILLAWIPIIGSFSIGQYSLGRLISQAKWRELRGVQERVERLKTEGNLEDEETMGPIRRLMDYHDRVARAPGSVLDLRAGLSFVNSLLLPFVALVLANLEKFLRLFSSFSF